MSYAPTTSQLTTMRRMLAVAIHHTTNDKVAITAARKFGTALDQRGLTVTDIYLQKKNHVREALDDDPNRTDVLLDAVVNLATTGATLRAANDGLKRQNDNLAGDLKQANNRVAELEADLFERNVTLSQLEYQRSDLLAAMRRKL